MIFWTKIDFFPAVDVIDINHTQSSTIFIHFRLKFNFFFFQSPHFEILESEIRVPTAPGKPGKMVTVFPAWKNPGILSFLPNIQEK